MRAVLVLALGLLATPVLAQPANKTIIVASDDGYGTTACLASGDHCGKVVADAMCVSEGYPRAHRFGPAKPGDVTAAIPVRSGDAPVFFVECGF